MVRKVHAWLMIAAAANIIHAREEKMKVSQMWVIATSPLNVQDILNAIRKTVKFTPSVT